MNSFLNKVFPVNFNASLVWVDYRLEILVPFRIILRKKSQAVDVMVKP